MGSIGVPLRHHHLSHHQNQLDDGQAPRQKSRRPGGKELDKGNCWSGSTDVTESVRDRSIGLGRAE